MIDGNFLSHLTMTNWRALLQWYFDHLNTSSLIQKLQQGSSLSSHDWYTIMVLNLNILVLFCLIQLFIKVHKQTTFQEWIQEKRSHLKRHLKKPAQSKLTVKALGSGYLKQAYNLHRFAMYDSALEKYKLALDASPDELNTYLLGIKIVSEMDEPNNKFIQFLLASIARLHKKNPTTWKEVVKYGREKTPLMTQWDAV